MTLTAERLRYVLRYDADAGVFTWRISRGTRSGGAVAGSLGNDGYSRIKIDRTLYLASRLAWLYVYGGWPRGDVDHRDRNPQNNRIENLREATRTQNLANAKARGASRFKGVVRRGNRWIAQATVCGDQKYLGMFATEQAAASAYDRAVSLEFGEFALTNQMLMRQGDG
jgi:hypothetical protein